MAIVRIPALADGSAAADGNPITNLGGYTHNGCEVTQRQSDTVFTSGTASFWSADGASIDDKTGAEKIAQWNTNGSNNLWIKIVDYDGVSLVYEEVQYDLDKLFTPVEVIHNEGYFGGTSGAMRYENGDFMLDPEGYVIFNS